MEYTGFNSGREKLYVGDIVSVYDGNLGFMEVVKRSDGFWFTDCSEKVWGHPFPKNERNDDFKLERNLGVHYRKVDKNNPTQEPPFLLYCDQSDEVKTGTMDAETCELSWTEDCAEHSETPFPDGYDMEIITKCKLCAADPSRKPPVDEIFAYFQEQYAKTDVCVVPGHWPDFQSKEEVDVWIEGLNRIGGFAFKEQNKLQ